MNSSSGVATLSANCYIRVTLLYFTDIQADIFYHGWKDKIPTSMPVQNIITTTKRYYARSAKYTFSYQLDAV